MKTSRISGVLGIVALTLIAGPFAMAQDSGWYLGANVGKSRANIDDVRITSVAAASGLSITTLNNTYSAIGFKVFGGYSFNKFFAFDGGYFDLGKFGYNATTEPVGTLNGDTKVHGFNFDAVLSLPITDKIAFFGRVGVDRAKASDTFTGSGFGTVMNRNSSEQSSNLKFGTGVHYDFTKTISMRAELERYRINGAIGHKSDIDLASIGLLIRLGRTSPAVAQYTPQPEPVAPVPVPYGAAVPVAVMIPAKSQQYCAILDPKRASN